MGIPADAVVALSAAAIKRRHKRVDYVLEKFAAVRQSQPELPVYLVLAGGWEPDTDELMAQGQARLDDRVRFLVRFPRQRMPELYRTADLFLLGMWGYRIWTSYTLFRWSALDPRQAASFRRLARSCLLWPLPYSAYLPAPRLVRVKRWGVLLRQLLSARS